MAVEHLFKRDSPQFGGLHLHDKLLCRNSLWERIGRRFVFNLRKKKSNLLLELFN